ncbi:hypothetical protein STENM223S_01857 [Streptomyces tendae]
MEFSLSGEEVTACGLTPTGTVAVIVPVAVLLTAREPPLPSATWARVPEALKATPYEWAGSGTEATVSVAVLITRTALPSLSSGT